jgi:magnesium-transporting ATPase (P-type)
MVLKMDGSLTLKNMNPKSSTLKKNHGFESRNDSCLESCVSQVYLNGKLIPADRFHENDGSMASLMQILVFCNEYLPGDPKDEKPALEKSLLDFAALWGFHKKLFAKIVPKIAELRSDGDPRTASAIIGLNERYRLVTKDEPWRLLGRCDRILFKGRAIPLTSKMVTRVHNVYQWMMLHQLRVVMLALKDMEQLPEKIDPVFQTDGLTLVGMIGLRDSVSENPETNIRILE